MIKENKYNNKKFNIKQLIIIKLNFQLYGF